MTTMEEGGGETTATAVSVGSLVTVSELKAGDGGVAKVTKIHDGGLFVDVQWVLGGRGKRIAASRVKCGDHSGEFYSMETTKWVAKVDAFFEPPVAPDEEEEDDDQRASRVSVLKLDEIINKKSPKEVAYVFEKLLAKDRPPVQVAFMQGAIPLQTEPHFSKLLEWLVCEEKAAIVQRKQSRPWRGTGSGWLSRRVEIVAEDGSVHRGRVDGWLDAAETKFRNDKYGPMVALWHVSYDDDEDETRPSELQEHELVQYSVVNGKQEKHKAAFKTEEEERCEPRLFSINLGELVFTSEQLERLRDALGHPRCGVTHLFLECNNLVTARYSTKDTTGAVATAVTTVEKSAVTNLDGGSRKNWWKDLFRELIRQNRSKHDLWKLRGGCLVQNAVVLQAVKNWFNPRGHSENKLWLKNQDDSHEMQILKMIERRERRIDRHEVLSGERVVVLQKKKQQRGVALSSTTVALDSGGSVNVDLTPAKFGSKWRWDDEAMAGDVVDYDVSNLRGFDAASSLIENVAVRQRNLEYPDWCSVWTHHVGQREKQLRFGSLDNASYLGRPVWTRRHAAGSTGAAAVLEAYKRRRGSAAVSAARSAEDSEAAPKPGDVVNVFNNARPMRCLVLRVGDDCRFDWRFAEKKEQEVAATGRRGHLKRNAPRTMLPEISSTELTRRLRMESAKKKESRVCDLESLEINDEFRMELCEGDTRWGRIFNEQEKRPFLLAAEPWEHFSEGEQEPKKKKRRKEESNAASDVRRKRLAAKYVGLVVRVIDDSVDELRRVAEIVPAASGTWAALTVGVHEAIKARVFEFEEVRALAALAPVDQQTEVLVHAPL